MPSKNECWGQLQTRRPDFFPSAHYHMSRRQTYCLDLRDVLFLSFDILLHFYVFHIRIFRCFFFNFLCTTFQMQYNGLTIWRWTNTWIFAISWPAQYMWRWTVQKVQIFVLLVSLQNPSCTEPYLKLTITLRVHIERLDNSEFYKHNGEDVDLRGCCAEERVHETQYWENWGTC